MVINLLTGMILQVIPISQRFLNKTCLATIPPWNLYPSYRIPSLKPRYHLKMDGWENSFLLGKSIFRCELLVSGRVTLKYPSSYIHRSGKWPLWRLKSSSRPPFFTSMIMGGRVTQEEETMHPKIVKTRPSKTTTTTTTSTSTVTSTTTTTTTTVRDR